MSTSLSTTFDAPVNDEEEIEALKGALVLSQGFKLFFLVCDNVEKLRHTIESLWEAVNTPVAAFYLLPPDTTSLYMYLHEQHKSNLGPVFVVGIDNIIQGYSSANSHPFIAELNVSRNSFIAHCPYSLVLGVSQFGLTAISTGAPDFFSIRSGVFYLDSRSSHELDLQWIISNSVRDDSTLEEKAQLLRRIEPMLQKLAALTATPGNLRNQMFLLTEKFNILGSLGRYAEAEEVCRADLAIAQQTGDTESQAISWINLSRVLSQQGKHEEAQRARQEANTLLTASPNLRPAFFQELGIGLIQQAKYEEAIDVLDEARRALSKLVPDHVGREPGILTNMGIAYSGLGKYDIAEQFFREALALARNQDSSPSIAHALGNLAVMHSETGRWQEASTEYAEAARSLARHGLKEPLSRTLTGWADVNQRMGNEAAEAFLRHLAERANVGDIEAVQAALDLYHEPDAGIQSG